MRRGFNNDPLRDLELELELLKRKRQVLQEKRQIMEEQRQFDRAQHQHSPWAPSTNETALPFQQTSYTSNVGFGNSKNFQNYSNNNSSKRGRGRGSTNSGRNFATKRPAPVDSSWNPPERFAGSFRGGSAKKPKQTYVPKPFVEKPLPQSDTFLKGESSTPSTKKADQILMLRSNAPISNQLMGRLELLLGHILKELKNTCQAPPINKNTFSTEILFSVKQEIRARIQKALLNKKVSGKMSSNLEHYRKMYPIDTDQKLIEMLVPGVVYPLTIDKTKIQEKEVEQTPVKNSDTELFKKYLKHQFDVALKNKLTEMFEKLQKVYEEETKKPDELEKIPCESDDATKTEMADSKETLSSEESEFEKKMDSLIRKKLYFLLPQYKQFLRSILKTPLLLNGIIKRYAKGETPFVFEDKDKEPAPEDNENNQKSSETGSPLHVVRVVGHPFLPPKDVMKEFLNGFNPLAMKKYNFSHNVLYVELPNEKCFNDLMAASGTSIDNSKIIVKRENMDKYKKKRSISKSDSVVFAVTNGEGKTNQDDGDEIQENQNDTVAEENADGNVMKEKALDNKEIAESEKVDLTEVIDTINPEVTMESVTQAYAKKEVSAESVNDTTVVDDVDLNNMDQGEAGIIKKEPDEVGKNSAIYDVDQKNETDSTKTESNDINKLDDSFHINKNESINNIESMKCGEQVKTDGEVAIEDSKDIKINIDNVKNDVTNDTVIDDKVIDDADEGWNTNAKDDWADLKEKVPNDEPPTPVRVTRSSRRLTTEFK